MPSQNGIVNDNRSSAHLRQGRSEYNLEGNSLAISIDLSKPLMKDVQSFVHVFGYRHDREFAHMPKLHIRLDAKKYSASANVHGPERFRSA